MIKDRSLARTDDHHPDDHSLLEEAPTKEQYSSDDKRLLAPSTLGNKKLKPRQKVRASGQPSSEPKSDS